MKAALLLGLVALPSFAAEKTLWLVRPLYPGQEALAGRIEQSLDKLTPQAMRGGQVIGHAELVASLKGKKADDLPCFQGETRCADPTDPFIANLGFERIVLIQGGQDEAGFKFKVVSYEPSTGKTISASSTDASLDNAMLGAIAKVFPVTAALDVTTTPPGATVFVDDRKVGVTPVAAQVLPGERVVRIDLKLHQGIEETVVVPMRGSVKLDRNLEKVAARIIITAQPAGTSISLDGTVLGKDRVDRGVQPGTHTIRLTTEGYKAFEQTVQVKSDEQFTLDKTLDPLPGTIPREVVVIKQPVVEAPPPQPPPPPPSTTDLYYERKSYFYVGFEYDQLHGTGLVSHRFGDNGNARTASIDTPTPHLLGGTFEFGYFGRYFGLAAIGFTVETGEGSFPMTVGRVVNKTLTGHQATCPTGEDGNDAVTMALYCYPTQISAKAVYANLRFVQPAFRVQVWRFMFSLQAGLELRIGQVTQVAAMGQNPDYNDGFMILDLGVSGRLGVRFYIADGFFIYGNYRVAGFFFSPLDPSGAQVAGITDPVKTGVVNSGFSGGLGYAF
ncbi:MAG: PEGA domain-containing protein [Archangiaceae bacterium]|nr:PEGA domain-containing protein [Archangiaceae bacterium]